MTGVIRGDKYQISLARKGTSPGQVLRSWHDGCVTRKDTAGAARLLRGVLGLVDAGELEASSAQAIALVRRIEGAVVALEHAAR